MKRLTPIFIPCLILLAFVMRSQPVAAQEAVSDDTRALLEAVAASDYKQAKALIGKGADVNQAVPTKEAKYRFFISRDWYMVGTNGSGEPVYVNALHANAITGDLKMLKLLLKKGANIDAGDSQGKTALMYALRTTGGEAYALELIANGANYTSRDQAGNTAMHYAALGGNAEGIHLTAAGGTEINTPNDDGITPLHAAAARASVTTLEALQALGADVSARDGAGFSALHYAARYGRGDKIKWILQQAADLLSATNDAGFNALDLARRFGNDDAVIALRRRGAKFDAYGYEEMVAAVGQGDFETVRRWLDQGTNPNRKAETYPIHTAAAKGDNIITDLLLKAGADPKVTDPEGRTALDLAIRGGYSATAEILLKAGAVASGDLVTVCLSQMAASENPQLWKDVLRAVIQHSDAVDQAGGKLGIPPLHYAAYMGQEDIVSALVDAGAKVGQPDIDGWTPLHWAVMKGDLQAQHPEKKRIAELLIAAGALVNARATAAKRLPHSQPYLARRVPANATPWDLVEYALPKDLALAEFLGAQAAVTGLTAPDVYANGVELLKDKDYQTALLEFNRALKIDPDYAEAYFQRGQCKIALNLWAEADRDLNMALRMKPEFPEAYFARGAVRFENDDFMRAMADYNQCIRLKYREGECHYKRAKCKIRMGDGKGACDDFDRSVELGFEKGKEAKKLYCKY